ADFGAGADLWVRPAFVPSGKGPPASGECIAAGRPEPTDLHPLRMGGNRKALARLERLLKNSNVDAFEGADLQVRHCKPFISVITGGFSPEESAVSFQHDYFSRSLGTKLRKKRSELGSGLDYGGTEAAARVCDERRSAVPLT